MNHDNRKSESGMRKRRHKNQKKVSALLISLLIILVCAVGGSVAYLVTQTEPVVNTFTPTHVTTKVTEDFDGTVKKNVNATNTGNIDAYIRIKLVTYRVNDKNERIGGTATIPAFTPGAGWVKEGDYYYYTSPVAPNRKPDTNLIGDDGISLVAYQDADGGKQVIEVMAEAIQAAGYNDTVAKTSWGVKIEQNSVAPITTGN